MKYILMLFLFSMSVIAPPPVDDVASEIHGVYPNITSASCGNIDPAYQGNNFSKFSTIGCKIELENTVTHPRINSANWTVCAWDISLMGRTYPIASHPENKMDIDQYISFVDASNGSLHVARHLLPRRNGELFFTAELKDIPLNLDQNYSMDIECWGIDARDHFEYNFTISSFAKSLQDDFFPIQIWFIENIGVIFGIILMLVFVVAAIIKAGKEGGLKVPKF